MVGFDQFCQPLGANTAKYHLYVILVFLKFLCRRQRVNDQAKTGRLAWVGEYYDCYFVPKNLELTH